MRAYRITDGIRIGAPLALPAVAFGIVFGVLARSLGWGVAAPIVMSVFVFSSSAQFAAAGVLATGGGPLLAIASGTLANLRFLAFGLLVAPVLRGGALRRGAEGLAVNDASLALATRDGAVSRELLLGATVAQAIAWMGGTAIGVLAGLDLDPLAAGLDVTFPAFFAALLVAELAGRSVRITVVAAVAATLALVPLVPAGLPVLGAIAAAFAIAPLTDRRRRACTTSG